MPADELRVQLGQGYSTIKASPTRAAAKPKPIEPVEIEEIKGGYSSSLCDSRIEYYFNVVDSREKLQEQLTASTQISAMMSDNIAAASKLGLDVGKESDRNSVYLILKLTHVRKKINLDDNYEAVKDFDAYIESLGGSKLDRYVEFINKYGDSFVSGIDIGSSIIVYAQISTDTQSTIKKALVGMGEKNTSLLETKSELRKLITNFMTGTKINLSINAFGVKTVEQFNSVIDAGEMDNFIGNLHDAILKSEKNDAILDIKLKRYHYLLKDKNDFFHEFYDHVIKTKRCLKRISSVYKKACDALNLCSNSAEEAEHPFELGSSFRVKLENIRSNLLKMKRALEDKSKEVTDKHLITREEEHKELSDFCDEKEIEYDKQQDLFSGLCRYVRVKTVTLALERDSSCFFSCSQEQLSNYFGLPIDKLEKEKVEHLRITSSTAVCEGEKGKMIPIRLDLIKADAWKSQPVQKDIVPGKTNHTIKFTDLKNKLSNGLYFAPAKGFRPQKTGVSFNVYIEAHDTHNIVNRDSPIAHSVSKNVIDEKDGGKAEKSRSLQAKTSSP